MDLKEFDKVVAATRNPALTREQSLAAWSLGLAGEAGEVVDHIKKHLFHGHALDVAAVATELGDTLWAILALCQDLNIPPEQCMQRTATKLSQRYPQGFSSEASRNRPNVAATLEATPTKQEPIIAVSGNDNPRMPGV